MGGLYTRAQYLERFYNFWKILTVNPSGRGHFSLIAIHRLIFARHNRDRETHVAECESGSSRDLPRAFTPLVLVPDFPPGSARKPGAIPCADASSVEQKLVHRFRRFRMAV